MDHSGGEPSRRPPAIEILARGGVDRGRDMGPLAGAGVSYAIERNMEVRLELQQRTNLQTVLFNVVWRPWFFRDYADSY